MPPLTQEYWFLVGSKEGNIVYGDYVGIVIRYSLLRTSKVIMSYSYGPLSEL